MKMPNVVTRTHDLKNNFTFQVRAYRQLTQQEMRAAYFVWDRKWDKRRSPKNKAVEVTSIIGYAKQVISSKNLKGEF